MRLNKEMVNKVLLLLAVSTGLTLVEVVMVYVMRTKGPLPFKIKFLPDFEL